MEDKKYWIWLSRIEGLGSVRKNKLLEMFIDPEVIWNLKFEDIVAIDGFGAKIAKAILDNKYRENLDKYIKYMQKYEIEIVTIYDKEYPNKLRNIYDPPTTLYIKGNKEILNSNSIAIIGCRECSNYGKEVARKVAYKLGKENISIISGLAKGIDSQAHLGCLNAKGKTIAVLGSGLDRIYPKENLKLYNEIIANGGAIVSEYIIGTTPDKMNFPARNRIISGLSDGLVVVEAKQKSGTLITVDFALEQGKNIFVVPGNITSANSIGTNELIKQGAKCITTVEDILDEYPLLDNGFYI